MIKPRIGFVGVGRMGANMARRLNDRGFRITAVHDVNRAACESIAKELGAIPATGLATVTDNADVIVTVISNDAAQRSIFLGADDNLLARGAPGRIFVNCATLTPRVHLEIEAACRDAGGSSLESCMASSIPQARAGTLYLMCGGSPAAFESAKPVLSELSDHGRLLRYVGPCGTASQLKAIVNMVMNINTAGLAEGLGLASALKMDMAAVLEVLSQTGAASRVLATDGEDMVNRSHECFFSAEHAAKDSGIALELAEGLGVEVPLAAATKGQLDRMVALGLGAMDKSGIAELTFPGRLGR